MWERNFDEGRERPWKAHVFHASCSAYRAIMCAPAKTCSPLGNKESVPKVIGTLFNYSIGCAKVLRFCAPYWLNDGLCLQLPVVIFIARHTISDGFFNLIHNHIGISVSHNKSFCRDFFVTVPFGKWIAFFNGPILLY